MIDASQCRAARALLDWTQGDLAKVTGLSAVTIRAFERGGEMRDSNRTLLRLSFEKAGVAFIAENGGGAGVRLRDASPERIRDAAQARWKATAAEVRRRQAAVIAGDQSASPTPELLQQERSDHEAFLEAQANVLQKS